MTPRAWNAAWRRFWFTPSSPVDLGVSRALFFGGLLAWYASEDFGVWGDVSPVFRNPVWLFYRLDLPILPASTIRILAGVWRCALASAALGFFTRASSVVAFVLGTYLLALPFNFGKLSHNAGAVVMILGVLAVARSGDAVALDAWRRKPVAASAEYTWPVRTAWLVLALVFLGAGISKLRHAGLAWVTSDTMRNTLLVNHYYQSVDQPLVSWGLAIAEHPGLCHALAAGTMGIELAYPIALFVPALRLPLVAAGVGLLLGFRIVLGPSFISLVICHVFWVPWERLWRVLARKEQLPAARPWYGRRRATLAP
jgi:hypothetical protein